MSHILMALYLKDFYNFSIVLKGYVWSLPNEWMEIDIMTVIFGEGKKLNRVSCIMFRSRTYQAERLSPLFFCLQIDGMEEPGFNIIFQHDTMQTCYILYSQSDSLEEMDQHFVAINLAIYISKFLWTENELFWTVIFINYSEQALKV